MRNTLCVCADYKRKINLYVDIPDKMITQIITYIHLFNGTILGEGGRERGIGKHDKCKFTFSSHSTKTSSKNSS